MNRHEEYVRILPKAKTAVIFIHGIVGTPAHFKEFIPLVPKNWSVYNVLLAGHGKGVEEFANASMDQWKNQIAELLKTLESTHEKIVIVGHSMGTLFALNSAIDCPDKICALFLLASPLRISPKPVCISTALKILFGKEENWDKRTVAARNAYGIRPDKKLWKYVTWIPRYLELFREVRYTRPRISKLTVPCSCYQSEQDELVSFSSIKVIGQNPHIRLVTLKHSGHYYLSESDRELVLSNFQTICQEIEKAPL